MQRVTKRILSAVAGTALLAGAVLGGTSAASAATATPRDSRAPIAYEATGVRVSPTLTAMNISATPHCGGLFMECYITATTSPGGTGEPITGSWPANWPVGATRTIYVSSVAFPEIWDGYVPAVSPGVPVQVTRPGQPVTAPLVVSAPVNDSIVAERRPVFSGTGENGATIVIKGTTRTVATTTVANGRWSVPADFDLADGYYALTATQTTSSGATQTVPVTFTVAATQRPLTLTDPVAGQQYLPNTEYTFRGTASPFATIRAHEGDETLFSATADASGTWSATRSWGSTRTWTIDITQTPVVGDPDTITGFVWAPVDTK
jgi:hypothetical protein